MAVPLNHQNPESFLVSETPWVDRPCRRRICRDDGIDDFNQFLPAEVDGKTLRVLKGNARVNPAGFRRGKD